LALTGSGDDTAAIWDPATGEPLHACVLLLHDWLGHLIYLDELASQTERAHR
jgi:hypothetical protein